MKETALRYAIVGYGLMGAEHARNLTLLADRPDAFAQLAEGGRAYVEENYDPDAVLALYDEGNAHNAVDRHRFLSRMQEITPGLQPEAARIAAHGTFGLLNSTPHSGARGSTREVATLLRNMALSALTTLPAA